jgi:thymidylate synthase (FAD)
MTDLILHEDVHVELVQHAGTDAGIAHAARVSTLADVAANFDSPETLEADNGLIRYLMRERHGTPFEHNSITFRVHAPIMVFREWHRHRIQSYNEQSGRYTVFKPEFYVPGKDRPLINIGKPARPQMAPADPELHDWFVNDLIEGYEAQWARYERALERGITTEMARMHLQPSIMSSMYATANLRAWLHFLGLRTQDDRAAHVSRPQREIVMAAEKVEAHLNDLFPVAMELFNQFGRVAP